jgi:hypothetical protein
VGEPPAQNAHTRKTHSRSQPANSVCVPARLPRSPLLSIFFFFFCARSARSPSTHTPHRKTMEDKKAVIKSADMSDEMQQDAVDCAVQVRAGGAP